MSVDRESVADILTGAGFEPERCTFLDLANDSRLRRAGYSGLVIVPVAPRRAPHFSCFPKKSKQKKAPRHAGLAVLDCPHSGAVPRVVSKGHPWPIVPHLVSMPNAPLHSTCPRPPDGDGPTTETFTPLAAFPPGGALVDNAARLSTLRFDRSHAPEQMIQWAPKRPIEEAERRCCVAGFEAGRRESSDGPWMVLRSVPAERHRREGSLAQRDPYAGASVFGYFCRDWQK